MTYKGNDWKRKEYLLFIRKNIEAAYEAWKKKNQSQKYGGSVGNN